MRMRMGSQRRGFTLLELLLAMTIGLMLMVGLYFALDVHLVATDAGRTQVQQSSIARNVLKKISGDVNNHLATLDNPTTAAAATAAATATTTTGIYPFNLGVKGTSDRLTLYISKVPLAAKYAMTANSLPGSDAEVVDSDLRRISYWVVAGTGLARQEIVMVTSDEEIGNLPPGIADEPMYVIAEQIVSIQFQYFDGAGWVDSWDGDTISVDGVTPVGPPFAIAITMQIGSVDGLPTAEDDPNIRSFRHVVQIPTAVIRAEPPPPNSP